MVDPKAALVMLTDGRFPSGGHAYSAGMEQAVTWGDVFDLDSAEAFVAGRTATSAWMAAQVAGAAAILAGPWVRDSESRHPRQVFDALDGEVDARMASSAARDVSRQQGRRWLRAVRGVWPDELGRIDRRLLDDRHGWVVTGAGSGLLGLEPSDAATITLYEVVGTPLWAAVRLLGLDPLAAAAVVARLVSDFEPPAILAAARAADETARALSGPDWPIDWSWIASSTAPISDLASEAHLRREERLFAS